MKKVVNPWYNVEYFVSHEDSSYYYGVEVVEREALILKFPKKEYKVVGQGKHYCQSCGCKLGTEACNMCQKMEDGKYGHVNGWRISDNAEETYLYKQLYPAIKSTFDWVKYHKERPNYMEVRYCCHNCKWFNYHHLNYCYFCGGRLDFVKMPYGEFADKYKEYRSGY